MSVRADGLRVPRIKNKYKLAYSVYATHMHIQCNTHTKLVASCLATERNIILTSHE